MAAGVLIVLVGVARRRILSTLLGAALAVGGAILALQADEVGRELAIEPWWAWLLCGAGVVVMLMALVPRKGRIERVERSEPVQRRGAHPSHLTRRAAHPAPRGCGRRVVGTSGSRPPGGRAAPAAGDKIAGCAR